MVSSHQLTVYHTVGLWRELLDHFITARNGKLPWSTKAFVCTVHKINDPDVQSSGIFTDEFHDKHPREWTKQASITLEEATEAYMVEVIAASHCYRQQLISSRYSTCLLQWQGKEGTYSWNSPTCAWPWTVPKWPKRGFPAPQYRKHNTYSWNLAPRFENRRSGVLGFLGIKRWRLRLRDTQLCFVNTTFPDAFLATMAPQTICRHAVDAKEQVHLRPTYAGSRLQSRRHLCLEHHPPQPVTHLESKV